MISDKRVLQLLGLSIVLCFSQCGPNNEKEATTTQKEETQQQPTAVTDTSTKKTTQKEPEKEASKTAASGYSAYQIKGVDSALKVFKKKYSEGEQYIILALNRLDAKHMGRADTLIIPDKIDSNLMAYSPYPTSLDAVKDIPKIIFFSYPIQAFGAYENGKLVYWGPTSMGSKIHPTPAGLHFTNWKGKQIISTVNDEWKLNWNFNIANKDGVGWHEYDLPGYPASHSCLRLLASQAKWLYVWANQWILDKKGQLLANGTPVVVFGEYPFGKRRPWKNLLNDPNANTISEKDLSDTVQPYLEKIKAEQERRTQVEGSGAKSPTPVAAGDTVLVK
jgi:hypothetical protein